MFLADADEWQVNLVPDLPCYILRDADAARLGQRLEARRDVHTITLHMRAAMHHVAKMQADAEDDVPVRRIGLVSLMQRALNFHTALYSFQRAVKLHKERVAGGLNLPAVMPGKNAAHQPAMLFKKLERQCLVFLRERAVAHHVREHDGCQPPPLLECIGHSGFVYERLRRMFQWCLLEWRNREETTLQH
ncbi:hypothetical protein L0337_29805 [candidate division KSB1 bacterium]|nr:hypothetical protein [candidate division KSB1 bacterium]